MRSHKIQTVVSDLTNVKEQYKAEQEVHNFLKAIHSYAARFAQNPQLSFDDHLFMVTVQSDQPNFA